MAQTQSVPPLYNSLKKIVETEKEKFLKRIEVLSKNSYNLNNLDGTKAQLDPEFLNALIINTPSKYIALSIKDKCSFFDLILANLVQDYEANVQYFLVNVPDKTQPIVLTRKDFIEKVVAKQCPQSIKLQDYFNLKNITMTLNSTGLKVPRDYNECQATHNELLSDVKSPYMCSIYELVDSIEEKEFRLKNLSRSSYRLRQLLETELIMAKGYKGKITDGFMDFFGNFCTNIESVKNYCENFFNTSYFSKVTKKERPEFKITSLCESILGRTNLKERDYAVCAKKLDKNDELCLYHSPDLVSLNPKPNCTKLSKALNFSKLNNNYKDCPTLVGNEGVVNIARLIAHHDKNYIKEANYCGATSGSIFLNFNQKALNEGAWGNEVCYDDKIQEKEICFPVFFGSETTSKYSLDNAINEILYRSKGLPKSQLCKTHFAKNFNRNFLENKIGCHIVLSNKCKSTDCEFKVYYNDKLMEHIKKKSEVKFYYIPYTLQGEKLSQLYTLESELKKTHKKIQNLTELQTHFTNHPNSLLHGIGCAEDLLPSFFHKKMMSECRPISFIVESYFKAEERISLVVTTSLDEGHTPRIISWSQVFSAIRNFQEIHPMKSWSLHAIY